MPDGGRLTIETENCWIDGRNALARDFEVGPYLKLSVSDTGIGMPPDIIAKAFDPFFTTEPLGQGTGLGLSMIYGFAKQSGGQVRIHSQPGEGTTVTLFLPRHTGGTVEPGAPNDDFAAIPRAERGGNRTGRRRRTRSAHAGGRRTVRPGLRVGRGGRWRRWPQDPAVRRPHRPSHDRRGPSWRHKRTARWRTRRGSCDPG